MRTFVFVLPVAVWAMAPAAAQTASDAQASSGAQSSERPDDAYVSGSLFYTMPKDLRSSVGVRGGLDNGLGGALAIGRRFGPVRGEIEGSYRQANVGNVEGFGLAVEGTGKLSALSAMANVYVDPAFQLGPFQPYVGGGIGIARFRVRDVSAVGLPAVLPVTSIGTLSESETGFAYQLMAGLGVAVGSNSVLRVGYRYFATPSLTTDVPTIGDVKIDGLKVHGIEVGFRIGF